MNDPDLQPDKGVVSSGQRRVNRLRQNRPIYKSIQDVVLCEGLKGSVNQKLGISGSNGGFT
jgi:hypothetical protein